MEPVPAELTPNPGPPKSTLIVSAVVLILAGLVTGFVLSSSRSRTLASNPNGQTTPKMVKTDKEVGLTDTKTFSDSAVGVLETGGFKGEGTHKLNRDNRADQTVYLISSVVDLEQYVGKKVEVYGQTIDAQFAPWLMDVGRVKLLE